MRSLLIALLFGVLFTITGFSQDKNGNSCCSDKQKTTMNKNCNGSDEVSVSSNDKKDLIASVQGDDKNKKVEKNVKSMDKNMTKDKSKCKSSGDGCCSTDKKMIDKTKESK
jgi:hypothetical protein